MQYYQSKNNLIQYSPIHNTYRIMNTLDKKDNLLSKEEFDNLKPKQLDKQDFFRLMNKFYKETKLEWEFEGEKFRKLDNFDKNGNSNKTNLKELPNHNFEIYKDAKLVFYRGRVYYLLRTYPRCILFFTNGKNYVRTSITNVAPIFNITKKEIV